MAHNGRTTNDVRTFAAATPGRLPSSNGWPRTAVPTSPWRRLGSPGSRVWHILSPSDFTLILAHAAHVKNGPGGKTDVADALWLADLLAHGLIGPSFVPDLATQEMPGLLRTRQQLVREQASHLQRIQKVLEEANVKLASVLTDIMGLSGRAVLAALIAAETDPDRLLGLIDRRVKAPAEKLRPALQGRITDRHRFLLRLHLRQIDALRDAIAAIDQEVDREIAPFRDAIRPLRSIPGVGDLSAQIIISEIGIDMGRFPDAAHRIAWAGLCPRSDESAGKRRSTRLRKGGPWLKTTVIQCAWSAVKQRSSYLHAQFQRLRQRRGPQEGHLRRCRLDPDSNLSHAARRHLLSRPRARLPKQACAIGLRQKAGAENHPPRL